MKVYKATGGFRTSIPASEQVAVEIVGRYQYTLPHFLRHSPDGFAWGYNGSGPAELARCILLDYFDAGGREESDKDAIVPPGMYQDFKRDFIVPLDQHKGWRITEEQIAEWLRFTQSRIDDKAEADG